MKTISARQFRLNFQELTEPVSVTRRMPDGEYVTIGTWSPTAGGPIVTVPQVRRALTNLAADTFRPVPKPSKR